MTIEQAKDKIVQLYELVSEDMKQAIDVLVEDPTDDDCISRKSVVEVVEKEEFKGDALSEIMKMPCVTSDLSSYSDKLWKLAYERGKREGLNIPKNATNGEMIFALYPNACFSKSMVDGYVNQVEGIIGRDTKTMYFDIDWWDAPYKQEVEE